MTASPHELPRPGDLIAGKYQVEAILGKGGMGVVVSAHHLTLRRRVAVKFLLPSASRLPDANARFLREAQAAVAIRSEHVAHVLDVGELENGAPYIVMEHLTGTDLGRMIKTSGAIPYEDAVDYTLQTIEAITEAHALGIIHRDLKPTNLFVTTRNEGSPLVKVLDFGLSKMTAQDISASEGSLTAAGVIAGSPHYMSPEQIRSLKHVDERTDIWALGVILYELLTGKRPFDGPSLTAICASVIADTPAPIRALAPAVPPALDAAVMRCLEKDPSRRTPSAAEIALAIAPFAPSRSWPSIDRLSRRFPGHPSLPSIQRSPLLSISSPISHPALAPAAPPSAPSNASLSASLSNAPISVASAPNTAPPNTAPPNTVVEAPDATTVHIGAWGTTGPPQKKKSALPLVAAGLGAVALSLLFTMVWLVARSNDPSPKPAATTVASEAPPAIVASASPPEPPAQEATTPPPAPSPTPSPVVSAAAPPPAVSGASVAKPPPQPAPPPAAKPQKPRRNPLDRSD